MKKDLLIGGLLFIIFELFIICIYLCLGYFYEKTTSNLTSLMVPFKHMNRNSTFCCSELTLKKRYKMEFQQLERYHSNQLYNQPLINSCSEQPILPYFYSLWKTSSLIPRSITPCEHQVYIKLMKIFDQICRKNHIEYMISSNTLLGSYKYHDILPYNDNVNVYVHVKYYSRLANMKNSYNQTDWIFYPKTSRSMKFFFHASLSTKNYKWKWPFIDIRFFTDNSTHIKLHTYIKKDSVFPLILRPIATLWLPGPRNVHKFLKLMSKYEYSNLSFHKECYIQTYAYRDENYKYKQKTINCIQLYNVYPYIRRVCDSDYCYEYFMLNDATILYILKMTKDK